LAFASTVRARVTRGSPPRSLRMCVAACAVLTPTEKKRLKLVEARDGKANALRKKRNALLDQAAKAETGGWRTQFEREAQAVLYELQHLIHENGELEILQTDGKSPSG
jgi:hypothetical protein